METNSERRKRKLADLCRAKGGYASVAAPASLSPVYVQQICKGVLLPPKKGDGGARTPRSLGDSAARAIEGAHDLSRGWFDNAEDYLDMTPQELLLLGFFRSLDPMLQSLVLESLQKTVEDRTRIQEQWQQAGIRQSRTKALQLSAGQTHPERGAQDASGGVVG